MSNRAVTEDDFRAPEFRGAKVEDYEFDGTGSPARKDRWETGIRQIVGLFEDAGHIGASRRSFKIDDTVRRVRQLLCDEVITRCQADCDGNCTHHKCPQRADGEPRVTGRHCPLDNRNDGE